MAKEKVESLDDGGVFDDVVVVVVVNDVEWMVSLPVLLDTRQKILSQNFPFFFLL